MALLFGVVELYNPNGEVPGGIIAKISNDGKNVDGRYPFRYRDGHFISNDGKMPIFFTSKRQRNSRQRLRHPEIGDEVVFVLNPHPGYAKACPWGYKEQWDQQMQLLRKRPIYRLVQYGGAKADKKPLWQGKNLLELSARYPRVVPHSDPKAIRDPLKSDQHGPLTGGVFQTYFNGYWRNIIDPRHFVCCLPPQVFKKYGPKDKKQPTCFHTLED